MIKILKAKKSLGQNFLKSETALQKIVAAGEISKQDTILEIGPGKGVLTARLLEKAGKVIAVEKDDALFELLKMKFQEEIKKGKLVLLNSDILDFETATYDLAQRAHKIIANIPYNITGAILKKFLTSEAQPQKMVLMVQHEVAQRIVARDGKESILSVSVKAYGEPKLISKVEARYFSPAPKVDSAIVLIDHISRDFFIKNSLNEENFWKIVKLGFAHKRKKLSGNLKSVKNFIPAEIFAKLGNKRAEDLKIEEWIPLIK